MKKQSNIAQRARLATATVLVAMALIVTSAGPAPAATEQQLIDLINCTDSCRAGERGCQSPCCGRVFCKRSCLFDCSEENKTCLRGCYDNLGGSPSGAFFESARLFPKAHVIRASGPLLCPEDAEADISVTISQSSGAIAQGRTRVVCPAGESKFTVRTLAVGGKPDFQELGTATACAVAQIYVGSQSVETLQWCRDVTLLLGGHRLED